MILTIIATIGLGIFWTQFQYNPAILPLNSHISNAAQTSTAPPLLDLPAGMVPLAPPEMFDSASLSDKINGKAELYLSAGFVRLRSQRFKLASSPGVWLEFFEYDMADGTNAFAVFSAQRRQDAQTLDLTPYAYRTPNALFFVRGPYYVEIIASEASEELFPPMQLLAEAFIGQTQVETKSIAEPALFPKEGLAADSITLIAADAFGFDRLDHVYTALYSEGDAELLAFISRRKTPQEAEELARAYHEFLITYGGQSLDADASIPGAHTVTILESYEVIFCDGPYLAGVREAEDLAQAQNLAQRLHKELQEVRDAS
ncbi:MAG: hypothetical protein JSW39_05745 [Desulfobacterales bacterium]|nr:MAG: hypothetical protein JSW39_05745 [Desulfobacterales bacterium]